MNELELVTKLLDEKDAKIQMLESQNATLQNLLKMANEPNPANEVPLGPSKPCMLGLQEATFVSGYILHEFGQYPSVAILHGVKGHPKLGDCPTVTTSRIQESKHDEHGALMVVTTLNTIYRRENGSDNAGS